MPTMPLSVAERVRYARPDRLWNPRERRHMRKAPFPLLATGALIATLTLGGCGGSDRWCEHDATDTRVDDSYCEKNTPGYEWEYDDGKSKKKSKTKSKH
ncbi:hypothetical protein Arub01_28030 [Actinomadura rubrobrunea]|uniref:Uncharacterized protein n=2 Tax=Actinomadura rubrobrunea TaxID=115335 RepID=A0A9W6PU59_9ACTN|nr:hypothetical protein Arub01_28030 [Actinomadura rubrobrunea]